MMWLEDSRVRAGRNSEQQVGWRSAPDGNSGCFQIPAGGQTRYVTNEVSACNARMPRKINTPIYQLFIGRFKMS
ncbi:hypothetical protein [Paraburkholderia largidicola]|uniref:hypothetical protein n=1 Tax=Paraburkholderia largidicola TaxID=3014751 RepID=UPI0015DA5111|nr:hypothetical protein [Paraburkholderia sp. PGU16]